MGYIQAENELLAESLSKEGGICLDISRTIPPVSLRTKTVKQGDFVLFYNRMIPCLLAVSRTSSGQIDTWTSPIWALRR